MRPGEGGASAFLPSPLLAATLTATDATMAVAATLQTTDSSLQQLFTLVKTLQPVRDTTTGAVISVFRTDMANPNRAATWIVVYGSGQDIRFQPEAEVSRKNFPGLTGQNAKVWIPAHLTRPSGCLRA